MNRVILLTIIISFIFCSFLQAEEVSLTLDEAIAIGLRDNRDVLLKLEDVNKAKEEINEAKAGSLPTVSVTGSMTNTKGYYEKDLTQKSAQATLKQYIYKGGKTINTIQQKKYDLEVENSLRDKTKLELALSIKKAFYTLLLALDYAELNKGIRDNVQEHLLSFQERYKKGQVSESDILDLESSLSSSQEAYNESLSQIDSSQAILRNLLYLEESTEVLPQAELECGSEELAYEDALLESLSKRPEIKQYEAQINSDKKAVEIAKADNRPSIYASWDYYAKSHNATTATRSWNDYNIIGLTFSWPIFDGWLTKSKVEQVIIDLKQTQLLKDKAKVDIALELRQAYLDLKDAIAKMKALESELSAYANNVKSANDKYKQGIISSLDLEDAILKYDISLFNKKQAIFDYIVAKSSLEKAMGGL